MNAQEARNIAVQYRENLIAFLQGVFGDVATAEKFARFTLQRLEVDFDEIDGDATSPRVLFALAREICREYVAAATFARLPLSTGDDGLPLSGVLPSGSATTLVLALPRTARLALRLLVVEGLAPADIEPVFGFSAPHLARFLGRIGAALPPYGKLGRLAAPLSDMATLLSPDPVAVAVRSSALPDEEPVVLQSAGRSEADTTQPGVRYTPPPVDAPAEAPAERTHVGARRTTRTAVPATSGSVPRGVSLSPLVTGGHPANRGPAQNAGSPYTRPFPTRTVAAIPAPPESGARNPAVAAGLVVFLLLAGMPISGFLGKGKPASPRDGHAAATSAAAAVLAFVKPAATVRGGIGTLDLPSGQVPVTAGQEITAPARGEAHITLAGVEIWLTAASRAAIHADRIVLLDGVARVQVAAASRYLGIADPLELELAPGTYVLRRGGKSGSGLATLSGVAVAVGRTGRGMRAETGRTVSMGRDGSAEARDTGSQLDDTWGREAARVARAVSDSSHFSALPDGDTGGLPALSGTSTGAGSRALYRAASTGTVVAAGPSAQRGAAGYRQAF